MAQITTSPTGLNLITGKAPVPISHGAGNTFINWITDVLKTFKDDETKLFTMVAYAKDDIFNVEGDYLLFFPAIAKSQDKSFKTLLAVGSIGANYAIEDQRSICLSGKIVQVSSPVEFDAVTFRSRIVTSAGRTHTHGNPVWRETEAFNGRLSDWIESASPGSAGLPFKSVSVGFNDIESIFDIPNCESLGLIPVKMVRQKEDEEPAAKNTLIMVGLDSGNNILLPSGNELWVCADSSTFGDIYPPWRTRDLDVITTL